MTILTNTLAWSSRMRTDHTRERVRFGLIGPGGWGTSRCAMIVDHDGADLVAVASRTGRTAEEAASRFGCAWASGPDDLVARTDVDVIAIFTPTSTHFDLAMLALDAGKHVLITKPVTVDVEQARRLATAARRADRLLAVEFAARYLGDAPAVHERYRAGMLGAGVYGRYAIECWRDDTYYERGGGWRGTWEHDGGGALMNQGIHAVDQMLWFQGEPNTVRAVTARQAHDIETEDVGAAIFEFDNGQLATLFATTNARGLRAPNRGPYGPTELTSHITTTEGGFTLLNGKLVGSHPWAFSNIGSTTAPSNAIADTVALVTGAPNHETLLVSGTQCVRAMEVVAALYESSTTDSTINLSTGTAEHLSPRPRNDSGGTVEAAPIEG